MLISDRFQTVFIHIPKCAGTSVREMLVRADPEAERHWGWRWMPRHQRYGDGAHTTLLDLPPHLLEKVGKYTVIALVRDPWERFLSAVDQHFMQHKYRNRKSVAEVLREIDSIRIRYDVSYIHFCPQHFFTHIANKQLVDHLLHLEDPDWEEKMRTVLIRNGFPADQLNMARRNERQTTRKHTFDGVDLDRFYRLYKRDFELFGYKYEGQKSYALNADAEMDHNEVLDFSAFDEIRFMNASFHKR